jgi:hypothetical protein
MSAPSSGRPASTPVRGVTLFLAVTEGVAIPVALLVILANLIGNAPVSGLRQLAVISVPLVIAGQIWLVVLLRDRFGPSSGWRRRRSRGLRDMRTFFFGPLNRTLGRTLLVLYFGGLLTVVTAFAFGHRVVRSPTADCPYRVREHGTYRCLSQAEFDRAGAADQRVFAGLVLAFCCLHTGAALGSLVGPAGPRGGDTGS